MQTEFFLRKLACFDNQNSRTQKRPALIHQQIPDKRDCYSKQTSQPTCLSFSSILVLLETPSSNICIFTSGNSPRTVGPQGLRIVSWLTLFLRREPGTHPFCHSAS